MKSVMNPIQGAVADVETFHLDKQLPRPPSHIHPIRHGLGSVYYRRLEIPLRKLNGYHFGVLCCAATSTTVFLINLIVTVWAVSSYGLQGGLGTIQDGSCKRTTTLGFWLHLVINALSTLLLGASNYSMQCLSSPTRSEIDKAHSQNVWLDVGIQSVRNLRKLSSSRIALWWLLAISSIPLHLLWNSAVFSSLSAREYNVYVLRSDALAGVPFDTDPCYDYDSSQPYSIQNSLQSLINNQASLQRLDNQECVKAYASPIISSRADVLLVASDAKLPPNTYISSPNVSNPLYDCYLGVTPDFPDAGGSSSVYDWMCDASVASCGLNQVIANGTTELMGEYEVQYCLSQEVEEHCKLKFSAAIMIIVIACNLIKTVCMASIVWRQDSEPLVTLGDVVASFLTKQDPTTEGNCLAGKHRYQGSETSYPPKIWKAAREPNSSGPLGFIRMGRNWDACHMRWDPRTYYWFRGASGQRWLVCNIL